jgi:pyruvate dehydrogenase E2 component (dihydrolipoamide acetyltransferase)
MGAGRLEKLTMPKWGLSMTHGTVVAWLLDEGAEVAVGTEVVEVETDKILSAVESPVAGVLRRQVAGPGGKVAVGGLLGVIGDADVPAELIDQLVEQSASESVAEQTQIEEIAPQTVEVAGKILRYLKRGEGGIPIILIHGFGGDLNNWLFNHEALAVDRAVYAVDLPGHGGSSKEVGDGSIESLADAVAGFMQATNIEQAHLVGHSLGGAVALALALQHPDLARSLTLIASAGLGDEVNGPYIDGFITAARRNQLKPFLKMLFADPALVTRSLVEDILKFKRIDGVSAALQAIAGRCFKGGKQTTGFRDRLGDIAAPIVVLWGAKDQIIPPAHAHDLPSSVQVEMFPDHAHMLPMEAATRVNRVIGEFVQS